MYLDYNIQEKKKVAFAPQLYNFLIIRKCKCKSKENI